MGFGLICLYSTDFLSVLVVYSKTYVNFELRRKFFGSGAWLEEAQLITQCKQREALSRCDSEALDYDYSRRTCPDAFRRTYDYVVKPCPDDIQILF